MSLTVKVLVPHIQDPNLGLTVPVDALELGVRPSAGTMRTPKLRHTGIYIFPSKWLLHFSV